jgi:Alpha-L-arabinofuranosidase B (ABFB) domain
MRARAARGGDRKTPAGTGRTRLVAATVAAGVLAVAVAAGWSPLSELTPAVIAAPRPPGSGVRSAPVAGWPDRGSIVPPAAEKVSIEAAGASGMFVSVGDAPGELRAVSRASAAPERAAVTLEVVPGFADPRCSSFRAADGRYLRHSSFRLRLSPDEGTALFRGDATFCARAGVAAGSVSLESRNFGGFFLRRLGGELWVDQDDGSAAFRQDSSFLIRPALI